MRRGISTIILITISLLIVSVSFPTGRGVQLSKLKISFPEGVEQTRFNLPVVVAGRWQCINITLNETVDKLTVSLYKGETPPPANVRNETSYYSWRYEAPGSWTALHNYGADSYLNKSLCNQQGKVYCFCVGVSQDAIPTGEEWINWTLQITSRGEEVFSQKIVIEKPETGIEPKTGTLVFQVEPFTIANLSSSFGIHNIGNTPVKIKQVSYNKLIDRIATSNQGAILPVDGASTHNVTIVTKKWPPGRIIIEGTTTASPLYWFPYGGITYTSSVQIPVPQIYIYVGHSDYELEEIKKGDITFQYKRNIKMVCGETKNVTSYICGNGNISFSLSSTNLTLLGVWYDGKKIGDPTSFIVRSTNTSEHPLVAKIAAQKPNVTGYIHYRLNFNGQTNSYTTTVQVEETFSEKKQGGSNVATYLVFAGIILVTSYIIYTRIKYNK
ncbi:MAG: hypothetical protein DRN01_04550 [Thermoplasmata archaeon]|nr:MAG: hypothetical protein DRN01_04550 [Thermoplasmata archaeon]